VAQVRVLPGAPKKFLFFLLRRPFWQRFWNPVVHAERKPMIAIVDFDESWANTFQQLENEIHGLLSSHNPRIEHIGSTSVVGLPAKPTIDILVGVSVDDVQSEALGEALKTAGYAKLRTRASAPRVLYVRQRDQQASNVHVVEYDGPVWYLLLLFRDYLRRHQDVAREYAGLKRAMVQANPNDFDAYRAGKVAFIRAVYPQIEQEIIAANPTFHIVDPDAILSLEYSSDDGNTDDGNTDDGNTDDGNSSGAPSGANQVTAASGSAAFSGEGSQGSINNPRCGWGAEIEYTPNGPIFAPALDSGFTGVAEFQNPDGTYNVYGVR
jgi:GrpB-like predicted nucleotidyltransferase (UPF0157 family)